MTSRRSRARSLVALACLAGVVPVAATSTTATAASTSAKAAASCSFSQSKKGGYFTSLKVTKVSCSAGKSLAKAHDKCRLKKGEKGYCAKVNGYKCSEKRNTSNPTELDSRVTCTNGSKKVVYTYQQLFE